MVLLFKASKRSNVMQEVLSAITENDVNFMQVFVLLILFIGNEEPF